MGENQDSEERRAAREEGIGELDPGLLRSLPEVCRRFIRENPDFRITLELNLKIESEKQGMIKGMGSSSSIFGDFSPGEEIPLLDRKRIHPPVEMLVDFFGRIVGVLESYRPGLKSDLQAIEAALQDSRIDVSALMENTLRGKENEIPVGLNGKLLGEMVELACRPVIEVCSRSAAKRLPDREFFEGSCPVCGCEPYLSILREEGGRRFLRCGLCDWEWRFPRLRCPFCDNQNQPRLRYLEIPGKSEKGWRVDVCLDCRGYLKTVDTRGAGEVHNPRILDVATLLLDILAEKEGYQRKPVRLVK